LDINKDGHVGGGGLIGETEQATHVDLNNDGRIGNGVNQRK
jgi:hypothetical protein